MHQAAPTITERELHTIHARVLRHCGEAPFTYGGLVDAIAALARKRRSAHLVLQDPERGTVDVPRTVTAWVQAGILILQSAQLRSYAWGTLMREHERELASRAYTSAPEYSTGRRVRTQRTTIHVVP